MTLAKDINSRERGGRAKVYIVEGGDEKATPKLFEVCKLFTFHARRLAPPYTLSVFEGRCPTLTVQLLRVQLHMHIVHTWQLWLTTVLTANSGFDFWPARIVASCPTLSQPDCVVNDARLWKPSMTVMACTQPACLKTGIDRATPLLGYVSQHNCSNNPMWSLRLRHHKFCMLLTCWVI